jgi:hypothetical protein
MGLARLRVNQFDQTAYDPGMKRDSAGQRQDWIG